MTNEQQQLEHLAEMRSLMERSTRFLSLSGLSGVWAGLCALAGAALVQTNIATTPLDIDRSSTVLAENEYSTVPEMHFFSADYRITLFLIGLGVLVAALAGAILLTGQKAKKRGEPLWNPASRRLLWSMSIPLLTGGIFTCVLLFREYTTLLTPVMLFFYGLALFNSSRHTLRHIEYLGLFEIVLGVLALFYPDWSLFYWALGFGGTHIVYGIWMYVKYDRA
jgi:uncharacterized membrane protein YidH (DUF202 family)